MYSGMILSSQWIKQDGIVIIASNSDSDNIVGLLPKGMIPHIEPLMDDLDNYCIQLDRIDCTQPSESMRISIDSLHHFRV